MRRRRIGPTASNLVFGAPIESSLILRIQSNNTAAGDGVVTGPSMSAAASNRTNCSSSTSSCSAEPPLLRESPLRQQTVTCPRGLGRSQLRSPVSDAQRRPHSRWWHGGSKWAQCSALRVGGGCSSRLLRSWITNVLAVLRGPRGGASRRAAARTCRGHVSSNGKVMWTRCPRRRRSWPSRVEAAE